MLLSVRNLTISFADGARRRRVVDGVDFDLQRGRTLGIVGESGSGKSVSVMSLMRLLPPQACIEAGTALFSPRLSDAAGAHAAPPVDLLSLSDEEMRLYRGSRIAMIFQEPMTSLNPVQRCGAQVVEMLRLHQPLSCREARRRTLQLFEEVQLPDPPKIFASYPHEISGGQKQRVMIAMALACKPDILIADEPTTALDVVVQRAILDLMRDLQRRYDIGVIFITHDLGVVAEVADDIAVLYRGRLVEHGPAERLLRSPQHPYTQGLLACRPPLDSRPRRLPTVEDYLAGRPADSVASPACEPPADAAPDNASPLLCVSHLSVDYSLRRSFWGRTTRSLRAVDDVSFSIRRGETVGLVGGSGCGKTTLGRAILRLIDSASGDVFYDGQPLSALSAAQMRTLRARIQIIFQDPYSSLNPHITVGQAVVEPLQAHHRLADDAQRRLRAIEMMCQVGLSAEHFGRYPHELSGGQRQRVCIARALVLDPELVVCDESVSALDVSVQAQVLNLLADLQRRYGYAYLFITHDLAVVHFLADRLLVMQQGRIVEEGSPDDLFRNPRHPYTRQLLSAIPKL